MMMLMMLMMMLILMMLMMLMVLMMLTMLMPGQPLDAIGGLSSPHLPAHHPYKQPTTNLEVRIAMMMGIVITMMTSPISMKFNQVQQQMKDLMNFPLAVYLNTVMSNPFFGPRL